MNKLLSSVFTIMIFAAPALADCGGSHGCGRGGGHAVLYLATLALGYWLLRLAEAEKGKLLKWVGRAVSWILLLASLCGLWCARCGKKADAPGCPYTGGMATGAGPQSAPPPPPQR
jgi:hypothetical protein